MGVVIVDTGGVVEATVIEEVSIKAIAVGAGEATFVIITRGASLTKLPLTYTLRNSKLAYIYPKKVFFYIDLMKSLRCN